MTGEQENAVNYAKAVSDAWNKFCAEHGLTMYVASENKEPIGKAFMAGWITGLGSLSEQTNDTNSA